MKFENKTAVVTGASVGIGRAAAHGFAKEGANVVLIDIDKEKLDRVCDELKEYNVRVLAAVGDVSDEKQMNDIAGSIIAEFGSVHILVNNAALWRDSSPFVETSVDIWKKYIDVNIMGVVYLTKALLPSMIAANYGRIINISSVAGVYGNINMAHYSATKGAVNSMTKSLAKELAQYNITVNSICPGTVSPSDNKDMDFTMDSTLSHLGRTGSNNENASLITYLASKEAAYISGQNIIIDGCRKII